MTPWWQDKRFLCPYCGKPITLADSGRLDKLTGKWDFNQVVAVCLACGLYFDEQEWRHRHGGVARFWDANF